MTGRPGRPSAPLLVERSDGYAVSGARDRLDLDLVHRWLSTDTYWAPGRSREVVARSIEHSEAYGLYAPDGSQVGFGRAVTDLATFCWVSDIYIDRDARGRGLGRWLTEVIVEHCRSYGVYRFVLGTEDAHPIYAKIGFTPLANPTFWMELNSKR